MARLRKLLTDFDALMLLYRAAVRIRKQWEREQIDRREMVAGWRTIENVFRRLIFGQAPAEDSDDPPPPLPKSQ